MIQVQLKLILRPAQERQLQRWLWHLTGVYNWAVKKIEADSAGGIYWSNYRLEALLTGHSAKVGVPAAALTGTVRTAHLAWRRCFDGLAKRPRLKGRRNQLNSIPFLRGGDVPIFGNKVRIHRLGLIRFHGMDIPTGHVGAARLVRRASGWYLCLFIQAEAQPIPLSGQPGHVGIDPGFSSLATLSTGEVIDHPDELRAGEARLGQAQRGARRHLTSRLLERQANRRRDRNHKLSRKIVAENSLICWSKDRTSQIARAFGKSVASAGHSQLRTMLAYKSRAGGRRFVEVPFRNSTRTCSACGALTGPAGYAGLKVRRWQCAACGAEHDRDCNAAINTLNVGLGMSLETRREAVAGISI